MGESNTTSPGYTNRNRQRVIRATGLPGTDHLQQIYVLCCDCGTEYGANGSDIFQRRCPNCQGAAPVYPLGSERACGPAMIIIGRSGSYAE
jgi:hypothetical protein